MTATNRSTPRPVRTRPLRDDLLDDLRQAAPMPTAPPKPDVPVPVVAAPETPTLELCVTPKLWWGFRMKTLGETPGVVIGAGPVQISLTGFRR
jgi:hypothetical protein